MTRRNWVEAILVFILVVVVLILPAYVQVQVDGAQREINCVSARANVSQLEALRSFSRQLGVPWHYPIPEVPEECDGH